MNKFILSLICFAYYEAISCIFPVFIFLTLAISKLITFNYINRYDFILIMCVIMQIFMIITKLESVDELKVICLFHLIGLLLEIYKVYMGSWSYPEEAYTKILGVPLYSGFMYASVASYICQSWKRMNLKFINWTKKYITFSISFLIYLNFFTHHFIYDYRWIITIVLFILFFKSKVQFTILNKKYSMPLVLSFLLIGLFIWVAENIATYFGAWKYPNQEFTWHVVHISKISSWSLLVIISIIIVANLKHIKYDV